MTTLSEDLLRWYDNGRRSMPWRERPGPYRTWISEAMLQQTQVATVLPYFERFMVAFPNVDALAAAPIDEVLGLWSGLGYYSRARNLHKAAAKIVADGGFPDTVAGWRALPGVGPYMAGAVASIALGEQVATVDGNIARVLSRVHRESSTGRRIWSLAEAVLPEARAGDHNQALMDLGATLCTPRAPKCPQCPIASHCMALQVGDIEAFPPKKQRAKRPVWNLACALIRAEDRVLLAQRPQEGLLGGLWEPPMFRCTGAQPEAALCTGLISMGLTLQDAEPTQPFRHILTHRTLEVTRFAAEVQGNPTPGAYQAVGWFDKREIEDLALSTLARKALEQGL